MTHNLTIQTRSAAIAMVIVSLMVHNFSIQIIGRHTKAIKIMPRTRTPTKSNRRLANALKKEMELNKQAKQAEQAQKKDVEVKDEEPTKMLPSPPRKIKAESQETDESPSSPSSNTKIDSQALVVTPPPRKKSRPSLSIPAPSAETMLDTCTRLHNWVSASGYGIAIATKGPVTGDKAYFKPVEQKISDVDDQILIKKMKIFGLVKIREYKGADIPKKQYWVNDYGATKSADWKVSSNDIINLLQI